MNELEKVGETINVISQQEILDNKFNIYGDFVNPLFLAKDIANWIENKQVTQMVESVDEDEKLMCIINTSGQNRDVWMLTENGLYEVLMLSRKPNAKKFKSGVKEILYNIRTTGGYYIPKTLSSALQLAANQAKQIEEQQKQLEVMQPKADFFDAVANSKTAVPMNDVAKTLAIKGMGRNKLFEFLRDNKILMNNNRPYQKYVDANYFRVIEQHFQKDGEECINFKTLVYQKGIDYIRKIVLNNGNSLAVLK